MNDADIDARKRDIREQLTKDGRFDVANLLHLAAIYSLREEETKMAYEWSQHQCARLSDLLRSNNGANSAAVKGELPRARQQEVAILTALDGLGYAPNSLPSPTPGKSGVKAACKKAVIGMDVFRQSVNAYDKAWERLMTRGEIAYA